MIKLLITGVGGPLGQAIVKAARASELPTRIIGTDRQQLSIGLDWVDRAQVIPCAAGDPEGYLAAIRRLCLEERVALILPGSESELELLAAAADSLRSETGAIVVCSARKVIEVALDKWETCAFLASNGHRHPAFARLEDEAGVEGLIAQFGFPLIAKPCRGSGSRGLTKLRDRHDLEYLRRLEGSYVVQEYLAPDEEEYTVAVYTERDGRQTGSISLKRELVAGNTYRAWVDQNPRVLAEAEAVVSSLGAIGPCNVQLRLTARGPVAFEINPRFSGTTAMRAHFGFNEVEMALREYALAAPVPKPLVRPGIALRFWEEVYLAPDGAPERPRAIHRKPQLRILGTDEAAEWERILQRMTQHDVYFLPAYHALAEQRGEGKARLFVYEQDDYTIALPLMLRKVAEVPELNGSAGTWLDATSVYGYGGPLASHTLLPAAVTQGFREALAEAMRELQVVGIFSRLHPLLEQGALLDGLGVCRPGGQTVAIDLKTPPVFRGTVRNRLNRLLRFGVTCERDPEKGGLAEFVAIYHETMRRVQAEAGYFFDGDYFERLAANLGDALQLWFVRDAAGAVIAGGLFTICDGIIQYHLGGTRDEALTYRRRRCSSRRRGNGASNRARTRSTSAAASAHGRTRSFASSRTSPRRGRSSPPGAGSSRRSLTPLSRRNGNAGMARTGSSRSRRNSSRPTAVRRGRCPK